MGDRHLPHRPDASLIGGDAPDAASRDARAREFGFDTWQRLEVACELSAAIHAGASEHVVDLIEASPALRDENVLGPGSNWGPPMTHAANLGQRDVVRALHEVGAEDTQWAFDRACLQGHIELARELVSWGAAPEPGAVMGPAETLNAAGLRFLLESGAELADEHGNVLAPVALLLQTYSRSPSGKRACLALVEEWGVELPETAPMAVHRGCLDQLDTLLGQDPALLSRTYRHEDLYPPALGCHSDHSLALHGTPLAGGTLLHMAVDYDEVEIVDGLIARGCSADARAAVDADGFGGHTALFGAVVSQPWRVGLRRDAVIARRLLDAGADATIRASLRKRLRFVADETEHEYHDVSAIEWGRQFHDSTWVNPTVMSLLEQLE
ncbi:MAG: ankyrin repeat domain-containing protein [Acidobacteria bacterium]|nr:ankyrin repeat domain-containing protein [Acidobacteriota bacterium]